MATADSLARGFLTIGSGDFVPCRAEGISDFLREDDDTRAIKLLLIEQDFDLTRHQILTTPIGFDFRVNVDEFTFPNGRVGFVVRAEYGSGPVQVRCYFQVLEIIDVESVDVPSVPALDIVEF